MKLLEWFGLHFYPNILPKKLHSVSWAGQLKHTLSWYSTHQNGTISHISPTAGPGSI